MRKLYLFLFSLFAFKSYAGHNDSTRLYDLSKRIFIEPVALIDPYNMPSLRLGIEWPVVKNFCSVFGVWGQYRYISSTSEPPYFGEYMRLGVRLYRNTLFTRKASANMYLSFYVFYKSQLFAADDNIEDTTGPSSSHGAQILYNVRKQSKGFHAEVGWQFAYRRICFEPYMGAGFRVTTVANSASDSLENILYYYNESEVTQIGNSDKKDKLLPSVTFGLRLSYLFKTRPDPSSAKTYARFKRRLPGH